MRTLYIECNMGVAGDMLMGALLELLPDKELFIHKMNQIGIPDVKIVSQTSVKCGITGTHVSVQIHGMEEKSHDFHGDVKHKQGHLSGNHHGHDHSAEHHEHKHIHGSEHDDSQGHNHNHEIGDHHGHSSMNDIFQIIDHLNVSSDVKKDVKNIYKIIADAESRVHGRTVHEIHFHEVGMVDAIADITGCVMLIHELEIETVITSPINVGFGQIHCAHGVLPVPAPATALILEGIPCYAGGIEGELCTPTGAAIIKYFTSEYKKMPQMVMGKIGYGMGKKDFVAANCVRAIFGETSENADNIIEFCCNIDDMTPEEIGYGMELLLNQGALDVFTTSIGMKKSRPGILLTVMCKHSDRNKIAELIFKHTSTIGLREYQCNRLVMQRTEQILESSFGEIHMKESSGYGTTKKKLEYEELKKLAEENEMSIGDMKSRIISEYLQIQNERRSK